MHPAYFIAFAIVWLAVIVLAVVLARAAALGDEQAEVSRLPVRLRVVRDDDVVSLYDHRSGDAA